MFPRGIVLTVFHLDVSDQFSLTLVFKIEMCLHLETTRKGEPDLLSNYSKTLKIRNKCGAH